MRLQDKTRGETSNKPPAFGIVQPREFRRERSISPLACVAPWAIAGVAVIALMSVVYSGDARQAHDLSPELPREHAPSTEIAERLAAQQEGINRLASQVEIISAKIAMSSPPHVAIATGPPPRSVLGKRPDSGTTSAAAVEQDLEKLRQYAREVADSIALIDVQVSDPAVLQRKLERQKAEIRPQPQ